MGYDGTLSRSQPVAEAGMSERILIRDDGAIFAWTEVLAARPDMKENVLEVEVNWRLANLAKANAKNREAQLKRAAEAQVKATLPTDKA